MGEVSNWIPTTFVGNTEGEADSLNSIPSDPPAPAVTEPVEPSSDDLSFDLISRQKLSLTPRSAGSSTHERLSPKGAAGIPPLFEEDTRSSWSVDSSKNTSVKESAVDEDSNSVSSQKSPAVKRPHSDDESNVITFPPENLFEYMWPQDKGEFYILQEQICEYLNLKSFKRKYPEVPRRSVDAEEKTFLRDKGVVTETQCDLGLMALKSEDVMELMQKDYPDKYNDYIKVLQEREKQALTEKHREYANAVDRNKIIDVAKKAVKSAAEYNAHLNQERKEERRCCLDLQTFTVHYPISRNKKFNRPKTGRYPVALLPGQYQDGYKKYSSEMLKFLPINTVLYGPLKEIPSIQSDGSDSEDSTGSDGSCSSSQGTHDDNSGESSSSSEKNEKSHGSNNANDKTPVKNSFSGKSKGNVCKVCKLGSGTGKDDKNEPLVQCSECKNCGHPTCLQLTLDMVPVLKTYQWQCMDCKICAQCRDPYDEDKMLFCDVCDRGYHTFCVGLKSLPQGKWACPTCGRCAVCGATCAGAEGSKGQWQYDSVASSSHGSETSRRQVVCVACSKRKR